MQVKIQKWLYNILLLVIILTTVGLFIPSEKAYAATSANKKAFEQELTKMLYDVDTSTHNVYKYGITPTEMTTITTSMKSDSCRLIWYSYYSNMYFNYTTKSGKINEVYIVNADSNVLKRYENLKKNVEAIESAITPEMTDLDKIIYIHDRIVDICTYKFVAYQSYGACGVLGDGLGVCSGYTKAMIMLLEKQGIEAKYISNPTLNHGWPLVKLDGEWYHVDPTWDDTRSNIKGKTSHKFLLRNDAEFNKNGHTGWTSLGTAYTSSSTKYTSWFVHDITGEMLYENGFWYYYDKSSASIKKANSTGESITVVKSGISGSSITLNYVENGVVTYILDGVKHSSDETTIDDDSYSEDNTSQEGNESTPVVDTNPTIGVTTTAFESDDNLKNYANWTMGSYDTTTASYTSSKTRLYYNKPYQIKSGTAYKIQFCNNDIYFRIYELNDNNETIVTHVVRNGFSFTTAGNCKQIAIEAYNKSDEYSYNSKTFAALFASAGFAINITETTKPQLIGNTVFDDISLWRTGVYRDTTGLYKLYKSRICYYDYLCVEPDTSYPITISDEMFRMTICQLDENYNFISYKNYSDKGVLTTAANCHFIGINLYSPTEDNILNFDAYVDRFGGGFTAVIESPFTDLSSGENATETSTTDNSVTPEETTAPEETTVPEVTTSPEETTVPEVTTSPEETTVPEVTTSPEETTAPEEATAPEETTVPEVTTSPEETTVPEVTTSPEETTTPEETTSPEETTTTEETTSPEETTTPEEIIIDPAVGQSILSTNFADIELWQAGVYSVSSGDAGTGEVSSSKTRMCTKSFYSAEANTTYTMSITKGDLAIRTYEFDANLQPIVVHTVPNGCSFVTASNCSYLALEIYCPDDEWRYQIKNYKPMFANSEIAISVIPSSVNSTYAVGWNSMNGWRLGNYKSDTGLYALGSKTRICLVDYLTVNGSEVYQINLSDSSYKLVINQMNSQYQLISSVAYGDGENITTDPSCRFFAVTLYSPKDEWSCSLDSFYQLFANGFEVGISTVYNIDDTDTPTAAAIPQTNSNRILFTILLCAGVCTIIGLSALILKKYKKQ